MSRPKKKAVWLKSSFENIFSLFQNDNKSTKFYCLLNHGSNTTAVSLLTTSKHFSREKLCYAFKLYTIIALSLFFLYFFDHKVNKRVKKCAKMSLNYLSHKLNAVIFPNSMVSRQALYLVNVKINPKQSRKKITTS